MCQKELKMVLDYITPMKSDRARKTALTKDYNACQKEIDWIQAGIDQQRGKVVPLYLGEPAYPQRNALHKQMQAIKYIKNNYQLYNFSEK